ncbi:MAG: apolipoprotein N-acyltransferase [Clostridia bacterium]|nr:apolipoprotein N-acyltransferase [Clostridia bacterium]
MIPKSKKYALPFLLLGAALTALTLIFPQVGFLEWGTMIPIFIGTYRLCGSARFGAWRTYWYGFLAVYVYYFITYHWFIALYHLDVVGLDNASSVAVVIAGWLGLSLLQAIPGGLMFVLFRLLHTRTRVFVRFPLLRPLVFSALWVVFEWSSTLSWTGVPWGRLCLGQIHYLPVLQSASLFGSYFISFLILLVNGLLAYAILYHKRKQRAVLCSVTAAVLAACNLLLGVGLMNAKSIPTDTVKVAVIQGATNVNDISMTAETYAEMTREAARDGAELVVWPESIFPTYLNNYAHLKDQLSRLAKECDVTLIVGALYADYNGGDYKMYNSLYMINSDGSFADTVYSKRHLVPFGEYVPMRELIMTLIPPLAQLSALDRDFSPGEGSALFETEWGKIGSLICFDSIYEELTRESVRDGAELMLLPSNDSWWFSDSAATYEHEAQAVLRAIESGRFVVRSGNTGVSTVISEKGEHLVWIEALTDGYAVTEVPLFDNTTLYMHVGNLFVYLCIGFYVFLLTVGVLKKKGRL